MITKLFTLNAIVGHWLWWWNKIHASFNCYTLWYRFCLIFGIIIPVWYILKGFFIGCIQNTVVRILSEILLTILRWFIYLDNERIACSDFLKNIYILYRGCKHVEILKFTFITISRSSKFSRRHFEISRWVSELLAVHVTQTCKCI